MSTLEKTIQLLQTIPENELDTVYAFAIYKTEITTTLKKERKNYCFWNCAQIRKSRPYTVRNGSYMRR